MLRKFKNLWAWAAYSPMEFMSAMYGAGKISEEDLDKSIELMVKENATEAQIIYPDLKKEILRANPEPSIDELLNI